MSGVSLFSLAAEYRAAATHLADLDLPPEVVRDTLESMAGELEAKGAAVGMFLRGLDSTIEAMKEAEAAIKARRQSAERRAADVARYLLETMQATNVLKIEHPMIRVAVRKNPAALELFDAAQVPASYLKTVTPPPPPPPELDKAAIKAALVAGQDVPGAKLTQGYRLEFR